MTTPLIIAAHGTRDAAGEEVCRALTRRVAALLPEVDVSVGFVELSKPSIPEALTAALQADEADEAAVARAIVVPLMLGTGNHVRADIPEFIEQVREEFPDARIDYARHLGPEEGLFQAVDQRLTEALGEWDRADTDLVFVGRGALVPDANADHVRLARMHRERGGWREVTPCFIQVTDPRLPEGLDRAYAQGARRIVVMGHWLFPGRLRTWTFEQSQAWAEKHPDCEVRVAEVIGDCDELAKVVVQRYREQHPGNGCGSPAYLAGLLLDGREVLVVGGGAVACRRVPVLLDAGARVTVVAPQAGEEIERLADAGRLAWQRREFTDADLDGCWYVQALTDDAAVNRRVAEGAQGRRIFCVRGDDGSGGTAWTPATTRVRGTTIGVVSNREPAKSRALRDEIASLLG